jgi:hypothetical protein
MSKSDPVWISRDKCDEDLPGDCVELWATKPRARAIYVPCDAETPSGVEYIGGTWCGSFDPKVFQRVTGTKLKPGELRCVTLKVKDASE